VTFPDMDKSHLLPVSALRSANGAIVTVEVPT
jgi:hypothetical protein